MANTNNPHGARPAYPVRYMREYLKGTNAAIYPGDFVKLGSDGKVVVATAGAIELVGVAMAYAAATATSILVCDDPDQMYYVQDDGVGGTLAATSVGLNADLVATAGNATFFKSQHTLDTSNIQTTAANLRILDKYPTDEWAKYVRCLVVINEHSWAKKTTGV